MTYYERASWGARPAKSGPGALRPESVIGIAIHWPAMTAPVRGVLNVKAALRGWQAFHMDDRKWSDIAYQEAIDQDGNVYELRGLRTTSGANGGTVQNAQYGALLLVLAPNETPTPQMMSATRERIAAHRAIFPNSKRIVGHGEIRPEPTACPGPIAQAIIRQGKFEPSAGKPAGPTKAQRKRARKRLENLATWLDDKRIGGSWWVRKAKKKTHAPKRKK